MLSTTDQPSIFYLSSVLTPVYPFLLRASDMELHTLNIVCTQEFRFLYANCVSTIPPSTFNFQNKSIAYHSLYYLSDYTFQSYWPV